MDQESVNAEVTADAPTESAPEAAVTPTVVPPETEPEAPVQKRSVFFFAGIAAVVLAAGGAVAWHYGLFDKAADTHGQTANELTEEEAAAPIAHVNGIAVTRGALEENVLQMEQAALAQGADPNDLVVKTQIQDQAYEITINNELLRQAAEKDAPKPTDEEIAAEIERLKEQNGGAEAFAALLTEVGFTEDELKDNVSRSLHIKAYLATKQTPVTVSDAEVTEFYDSLGGEDAGLPPLEDVREQVVAELEAQKSNAQVTVILEELRSTATIEKV